LTGRRVWSVDVTTLDVTSSRRRSVDDGAVPGRAAGAGPGRAGPGWAGPGWAGLPVPAARPLNRTDDNGHVTTDVMIVAGNCQSRD